jgi:nucleoside-diphosphate-sugar epimerase
MKRAVLAEEASSGQGGEIELWADDEQAPSFMFIDDCVEGIYRLMASDHHEPLNLGTDELVTVNQLVDMVSQMARKRLTEPHDPSKPQGVPGRSSDKSRLRQVLSWEPKIRFRGALVPTYQWVESQLGARALEVGGRLKTGR